jgi:quercetin dioxygenase-like cupin family protein
MAKVGDQLVHPVTGERIVWRRVSRDTQGELIDGDLFAASGGHPAAAHVHPHQEERFGVLSGTITLRVDSSERTLGVGEWAEIPVGRTHTWWNGGDAEAQVLVQISPALRTEMFFETVLGLAKDGKTNSKGLPNLLSMAVILREYREEIRLARPPAAVQTVVFAPLALLGRGLGHRGWYPKYSAEPLGRTSTVSVSGHAS